MVWGVNRGIDDILARLLANDGTLPSLYLMRQRRFGDADAEALCQALTSNTVLRDLHISSHAVSPAAAAAFSSLLSASTTLEGLDLGDSSFGDAGLQSLCPGIAASPSLLRLGLESKGLTSAAAAPLAAALAANKALQELSLAHNALGNDGLTTLAGSLGRLRILSLTGCGLAGAGAGAAMATLLASSTTLTVLRLEENALDAEFVAAVASGLRASPSLKELHLRACPLGAAGAAALVAALPPILSLLDITDTGAGAQGVKDIASELEKGAAPGLARLIACNVEANDAALAAVLRALVVRVGPISVDFSGNAAGVDTIEAAAACTPLQSACLHDCKLGASGAAALATALQQPGSFAQLEELDVSANGMEAAELISLLSALSAGTGACPALRQLVLAANPGAMEPEVTGATEVAQAARPGLDIVRRSADTGERDGNGANTMLNNSGAAAGPTAPAIADLD